MFGQGEDGWLGEAAIVLALADLIDGECPECGGSLEREAADTFRCVRCGMMFRGE